MVVREVPYDGYDFHEYDRVSRPISLMDVVAENWKVQNDAPEKVAKVQKDANSGDSPKVVKSRIRVQLSRALTWAEVEDLTTDGADPHLRRLDGNGFDGLKLWVAPNHVHVWAEAPYGSRDLYELIAEIMANQYVNVFPKAVRTYREYNGD